MPRPSLSGCSRPRHRLCDRPGRGSRYFSRSLSSHNFRQPHGPPDHHMESRTAHRSHCLRMYTAFLTSGGTDVAFSLCPHVPPFHHLCIQHFEAAASGIDCFKRGGFVNDLCAVPRSNCSFCDLPISTADVGDDRLPAYPLDRSSKILFARAIRYSCSDWA